MKKYLRIILMVIGAITLAWLIGLAIYHWITGVPWSGWTGFSDYTGPINKDDRGKTLWDWMGLLIIPLVLAVGAYWFNRAEKANEIKIAEQRNKSDQEIATDRQREQALQSYIDKMTELLLDKSIRGSEPLDESRVVARTRTLTTLRLLDSTRKGILLRFLFEAGLINTDKSIVDLTGADLEGAALDGANLNGANLERAYLKGANLEYAFLEGAHLLGAHLEGAHLERAYLRDAHLEFADLEGAHLKDTDLRGADLGCSHLKGSNLEGAHLEGAHLTGTIMPDGKKYDPTIHPF